jgi:CheY-like chemotaxis protein
MLMAEDDPNDVFLLERAFQSAGVPNPLRRVCDGQEAIEYLSGDGKYSDRSQFPFPGVFILDLKMPRKTGMDVLRWLRGVAGLRCLPVIIFSSSAQPVDVELAYQLGANSFVVKPSGVAERVDFARIIKAFWLTLNEPPLISVEGIVAAQKSQEALHLDGKI